MILQLVIIAVIITILCVSLITYFTQKGAAPIPPIPEEKYVNEYEIIHQTNGDISKFSCNFTKSGVIDWGDGTIEELKNSINEHQYLEIGTYTIKINLDSSETELTLTLGINSGGSEILDVLDFKCIVGSKYLKSLTLNSSVLTNISILDNEIFDTLDKLELCNNPVNPFIFNESVITFLAVENKNLTQLDVTNLTNLILLSCMNNNIVH